MEESFRSTEDEEGSTGRGGVSALPAGSTTVEAIEEREREADLRVMGEIAKRGNGGLGGGVFTVLSNRRNRRMVARIETWNSEYVECLVEFGVNVGGECSF